MKKILLITLALLASCLANADSGFYIGAKIGPSFNTGEFKSYDTLDTGNVHSAKGGPGVAFFGGLNLGYGYVTCSNIYLGIDGNLLFHTLKNEVRRSSTATTGLTNPMEKVKNDIFWGVAAQFGYQLCKKVIPYISLGFLSGDYKLRINNDGPATRGLAAATNYHAKKTVLGFNPGVGIKFDFCNCFTAGMQYDVLLGQKVTKTLNDAGSGNPWHYSQKITQHNLSLIISYRFY